MTMTATITTTNDFENCDFENGAALVCDATLGCAVRAPAAVPSLMA